MWKLILIFTTIPLLLTTARCPYSSSNSIFDEEGIVHSKSRSAHYLKEYAHALHKIDWHAVKTDIRKLLTDSQDWWPADYGMYVILLCDL